MALQSYVLASISVALCFDRHHLLVVCEAASEACSDNGLSTLQLTMDKTAGQADVETEDKTLAATAPDERAEENPPIWSPPPADDADDAVGTATSDPQEDASEAALSELEVKPVLEGLYKIKNKKSGFYLLAGSWGTQPSDRAVWQYPIQERMRGDAGFVWKVFKDGRIQNQESGMFLLAGSWGYKHDDRWVWQYPLHEARNGRDGFEWEITEDGLIKNKKSLMYLLAGSWGSVPSDRKMWQYPLHENGGRSGNEGFEWILEPYGGCGTMLSNGIWKYVTYVDAATKPTYKMIWGWKTLQSSTTQKSWTTSLGLSISRGFEVGISKGPVSLGASGSVTLSAEHSRTSTQSYTDSKEQTTQTEFTMSPEKSGVIWQFRILAKDRCGAGDLGTKTYAITSTAHNPPTCPPGMFKDPTNKEGACVDKDVCLVGEPRCHLLHLGCSGDRYPQCPGWAKHHCNNQYAAWMKENCMRSCGYC